MMRLRKSSFDPITLQDAFEMVVIAIGVLFLAVIIPNAVIYLMPYIGIVM